MSAEGRDALSPADTSQRTAKNPKQSTSQMSHAHKEAPRKVAMNPEFDTLQRLRIHRPEAENQKCKAWPSSMCPQMGEMRSPARTNLLGKVQGHTLWQTRV